MKNSGFLLINKPAGISSFDVIRKLRRITGIRKMGHAGTLDPFATGLLLIAIGNATRLLKYYTHAQKTYVAKMIFGKKTNTGDSEGNVIEERHDVVSPDETKLIDFVTSIEYQTPSKYSAIKIDGKKAYELARKDIQFEMAEKSVRIFNFKMLSFQYPQLTYQTTVSSGCYIRTLSEQIAEFLGSVAYTEQLNRMAIDHLTLTQSVDTEQLTPGNWREYLISYQSVFPEYHTIVINDHEKKQFFNGLNIPRNLSDQNHFLVFDENNTLLGIALNKDQFLKPLTVFNHDS